MSWHKSERWSLQLGRFVSVGVVNTVFGYSVIFVAMALGVSPYVSNALGYFLGWLLSYALNRFWVFAGAGRTRGSMPRYGISFALAYALNFLVLHIGLLLGWPGTLCQVVAGATYFLVMFSLSKIWVFKT